MKLVYREVHGKMYSFLYETRRTEKLYLSVVEVQEMCRIPKESSVHRARQAFEYFRTVFGRKPCENIPFKNRQNLLVMPKKKIKRPEKTAEKAYKVLS